ncbi:hypothetical protein X925_06220 [Petrotoga sp. 9T1HF07.CasAA.8.2]|nr:hypothetical protein X925_06220 [Petrotoga sp. 9T1HF07.CasAA.8.2]
MPCFSLFTIKSMLYMLINLLMPKIKKRLIKAF